MLLYRTHPTSKNTSSIINLRNKEELIRNLREGINHRDTEVDDITALVTDASVVDAMISLGNYENILVLPSPITQERLRNKTYNPIGNAGDMLFPIIHKLTGGKGNVYVGLPESGHLYKKVWEDYDVDILPMKNWFTLDRKIGVETDMVFDAVVLIGCNHSSKTGSFKVEDIKDNLKSVSHWGTDLIDINREGSKRNIIGKKGDISSKIDILSNSINSTKNLCDPDYGLSIEQFRELFGRTEDNRFEPYKLKTSYHYSNLCHRNVAKIKEFYKVYDDRKVEDLLKLTGVSWQVMEEMLEKYYKPN
jgi:hypothetical protein